MSTIQVTFALTGPRANLTGTLGSLPYRFHEGRTRIVATPEEMALHARFLERNWKAYPEGHPALEKIDPEGKNGERDLSENPERDGEPEVHSDLQPNGEGPAAGSESADGGGAVESATGEAGGVSDGAGQAPELNTKLQAAVWNLDPTDDTHWTRDGKPAMSAVEKLYGASDITRADVDAAAPGYTREKAREV